MKLTKEEVQKIAHLARLQLTDEEVERYANQLTNILDYVEMLKELDTEGVPETSQVTGLKTIVREDEARSPLCTPDELLACSAQAKKDHQLRIKRMM